MDYSVLKLFCIKILHNINFHEIKDLTILGLSHAN